MAKLGNITMLNQKKEGNKNPYQIIHTYLTRRGQNSKNTMDTYGRAIRDFFRTMRGKELDQLTVEDLIFTPDQIETYQVTLKEHYKGTTVNNAMTAIKECYEKLQDNGFPVDTVWFKLDRYDEEDKEGYGTLTHEEVVAIIDLVSKTRKGSEKALLIRLAYATAFRKESLLSMTWNQIIQINGIWYAKVLGKGNEWSHKKISPELYSVLMEHKGDAKGEDKVFELTKKTVNKMMNKIRDSFDFGDRHIVFHSFKKASINEVNIITGGDIKAMQNHGDHKNAQTTLDDYMANKKLEDLVVVDINVVVPVEKFDEMSKEELVQLLKSIDRNTQIKLLQKAGHM